MKTLATAIDAEHRDRKKVPGRDAIPRRIRMAAMARERN